MFEFSEATAFVGLFVSSFLSATLLPGGSEIVLIALIHRFPAAVWYAVALAALGNTLGGMTSYLLGRLLPNSVDQRTVAHLRHYGYWTLLFSWLPVVGDAFCVGAGWLRFNPWLSALLLALGKLARYLLIAGGWMWIESLFNT